MHVINTFCTWFVLRFSFNVNSRMSFSSRSIANFVIHMWSNICRSHFIKVGIYNVPLMLNWDNPQKYITLQHTKRLLTGSRIHFNVDPCIVCDTACVRKFHFRFHFLKCKPVAICVWIYVRCYSCCRKDGEASL